MEAHSYLTIEKTAEAIHREKGSRFLAFAYPVNSVDEINDQLHDLKKRYFDARHHCYAWMLGAEKKQFRAFDAGEPNHSAGDPILGQIRSRSLTNVLVVVVRYFGGVKLGVGGLVAAYKFAAAAALDEAGTREVQVMLSLTIDFPYENTSDVMKMVRDFDMQIISQDFGAACRIHLGIPARERGKVAERIALLQAMGIPLTTTALE